MRNDTPGPAGSAAPAATLESFTKPWYRSRAIWGCLVALLAGMLKAAGIVDLDDAAQAELVDAALEGAVVLGALVGIYGRLKAKTEIGGAAPNGTAPPAALAIWLLLPLLLLGGPVACGAGPERFNSAGQYAGMNAFDVEWYQDGKPKKVSVRAGKEAERLVITLKRDDGTEFTYDATGLRAFDGQALRAELERVQSEQLGEVAPQVTDALFRAVLPFLL